MEWPLIQARWFTPTNGRQITLLVIHRMEAPNKPETAEGTGHFFQQLPSDHKASAHKGYDSDGGNRYVLDKDVAYHAPGANHNGLGYELAGYSKDDDWSDPDVESMLRFCAIDVAEDAAKYNVPLIWRGWQDLKAGHTFGVTSHWEVTQAWHLTDHTDPGAAFPIGRFMELCHASPAAPQTPPPMQYLSAAGYQGELDMDINMNTHTATLLARDCSMGDTGWYELTADGGVQAKGGAPWPFTDRPGSYPALPATVRNAPRIFLNMTPSEHGPGWVLWSHDGGHYEFN